MKSCLCKGVSRDYKDEGDNEKVIYSINTDIAPKNPKRFSRFVRKSIDFIIIDMMPDEKVRIDIIGQQKNQFIQSAKKLARKAGKQSESLRQYESERDYGDEKKMGFFGRLIPTFIGGMIGYYFCPENSDLGAGIGFVGGYIVSELLGEVIEPNRRRWKYPLAEKAKKYRSFEKKISKDFIRRDWSE